jgi:hypothetical protein
VRGVLLAARGAASEVRCIGVAPGYLERDVRSGSTSRRRSSMAQPDVDREVY